MTLQAFQPIGAIATTAIAVTQLQPLLQDAAIALWVPESLRGLVQSLGNPPAGTVHFYSGPLSDRLPTLWNTYRSLVFCLATGAVVRLIAPLLQDKTTDPAVVVLDEAGKFVISLCGGHQGGADQLTRLLALQRGITPVLTGAANRAALPGIDQVGLPFGWGKGAGDWTGVSVAIARQQPVSVMQTAGSTLWQRHLPADHPFRFQAGSGESGATVAGDRAAARVLIQVSPSAPQAAPATEPDLMPQVLWHPRVLWVGIGCERGTAKEVIAAALQQVFQAHELATEAIAGLATIDLKADEVGLVDFCRDRDLPLRCFSAEVLRAIAVPNPSTVVEAEVGTPSVAEAAALQAALSHVQLTTQPANAAIAPLLVDKQIFRLEGHPGAVTIAVAQATQEFTGRTGQLWLVGTGPGRLDQITPAAQMAIAQADVVIGYSLYVELIQPLLHPGQLVEALPITQERQRAERAIALAEWGLTVAVVSSGDCGIYGMAGLVMEQLQAQNWNGKTPAVQVFPGITALQSAASRVGAPLMHDFCAISLSDLLTPWEMIEKRLIAAAQADFVVALYNPKSQTRTEQIAIAQRIFLSHRPPHTPVALVRSAYRQDEQITLTTLTDLLNCPVDMLTTVLIGNQSTRTYADWMITPRGYLGFGAE